MQSRLIYSQPGNRRLILVFAGWSTTPAFYRDLHADGWDIAVVWDYTSLDFDHTVIEGYSSVFIIAWSMGVAAAAHAAATSLEADRVSAAFAVNGTLFPSSDEYGIPADIYEATRATLNPRNLLKFTKRMGYVRPEGMPPAPAEDLYIPDFPSLAFELENIRDNALRGRLPWKRAYVSSADRIFPPKSMLAAWKADESRPTIIELEGPHYVHLQRIIDEITPDTSGIGRRFQRALPTYDRYASAQAVITERLVDILEEETSKEEKAAVRSLLEIGPGTGLLTRHLCKKLPSLESAVFVDLYPTPEFNVCDDETYVAADAERWILSAPSDSFDLLASANTIQWFADPATFFREASRVLRKDGLLLCSTFLPGNLAELDTRRPSPLIYRTRRELESMLSPGFDILQIEESPIRMDFPTRRDLLLHLKLTGVGGGGTPNPASSSESLLSTLPLSLTYRPLYILARRR